MAEPLLDVRGLAMHFPLRGGLGRRVRGEPRLVLRAVDGVDLEVRQGETIGLVGESGCGKSTLGRCIVGLYEPTAGEVRYRGEVLLGEAGPADAAADPDGLPGSLLVTEPAHDRAADAARAPARARRRPRGRASTTAVAELLDLVGLSPRSLDAYPRQFSGGQRQRVSIARALALEPELLVADEPVSALDVSVQATVLNLLEELREKLGLSILLIAHNMAVVRHTCDRVAVMYLGRIVETAPTDALFSDPRHPYTQGLAARPFPGSHPAARERRSPSSATRRARSTSRAVAASIRAARSRRSRSATTSTPSSVAAPAADHRAACHFAWAAKPASHVPEVVLDRSPRDRARCHPLRADVALRPRAARASTARGSADGPRVTLLAGIHGCEYSSIAAAVRFMRALDTTKLRG